MNRSIFAVVALAGMASAANAADFMKVDIQVSKDGGAWTDSVDVNPGDSVLVRFVCSFNRDAGFVAWGGTTLTQVNVAGSDAGDTATGFGGRTQPASQTFNLFSAGAANAKIDRLDNPGGSIQCAQLPPNNGGISDNPIVIFSFTYNVSNNAAHTDVTLDAPSSNMTLATLFTTAGGSSGSIASAGRSIDGATIKMVPTPGALAVGGLAGLAGLRRRRA
jgi:uncharacterized protein (TIGR03382 family)